MCWTFPHCPFRAGSTTLFWSKVWDIPTPQFLTVLNNWTHQISKCFFKIIILLLRTTALHIFLSHDWSVWHPDAVNKRLAGCTDVCCPFLTSDRNYSSTQYWVVLKVTWPLLYSWVLIPILYSTLLRNVNT